MAKTALRCWAAEFSTRTVPQPSLLEPEQRALQVSIEDGRLRECRIEREGAGPMVASVFL